VAYWQKHGRRGPSIPSSSARGSPIPQPSLPDVSETFFSRLSLPSDLVKQALLPLPETTDLFQRALASSDDLDESDLWRWKDGPPYVVDPGSTSTVSELYYTERLVEVMHGIWSREQHKDNEARRKQFLQTGHIAALESLHTEVVAMLDEWEVLTHFLKYYSAGAREMTMAEVYVQWQARKIYHLYHLHFME